MDKVKLVGLALLRAITSKAALVVAITTGAAAIGATVAPETADKIATTLAGLIDVLTGPDVLVAPEVVAE